MLIASLNKEKQTGSGMDYRNRDFDEKNLVLTKVYDLRGNYYIYVHFITKKIYEQVIKMYWWPINVLVVQLTIFSACIIIIYIQKQIVEPLKFMAGIAQYLMNQDKDERQEVKFQRLLENQ